MRGWRVFRLAGIDIEVHFTWIIMFFWFLSSMVALPVGGFAMHLPWQYRLAAGTIATLIFFGSLILHELAHSLVARHHGLPVHRITLFLFGGVSQLEEEPHSPADEFRMAIVGPLTSVVIGLIFWRGSLLIPPTGAVLALTRVSLFWVGLLNLFLAVFNMVPAFPLDGGRVLRSFLWWVTGDLGRSTHAAATLGRVFGYGMAGVGIYMIFFGHEFFSGLLFIGLGWLVAHAAESAYQRVQMAAVLQGFRVADFMSTPAITVPADLDLEQFAHTYDFMLSHGAYPVIDAGKVAGMLRREVLRDTPRHHWPTTLIRQVMEPLDMDTMVVDASAPLDQAFTHMMRTGRPRLMVIGPGSQLAGVLSQADVVRAMHMTTDQPPPLPE